MAVDVREKDIEEIEERLKGINTALSKISYLESALSVAGFSFEIKRYIWGELAALYEERKMFERAARAMSSKAAAEVTFRDKIDSYVAAAELFSKIGKLEDADEMFVRASRDANEEQKAKIRLARKNVYMVIAKELEQKGKRASAVKFYERIIKMKLDEIEKEDVKRKLLSSYKALGMFREAKLIEGM